MLELGRTYFLINLTTLRPSIFNIGNTVKKDVSPACLTSVRTTVYLLAQSLELIKIKLLLCSEKGGPFSDAI